MSLRLCPTRGGPGRLHREARRRTHADESKEGREADRRSGPEPFVCWPAQQRPDDAKRLLDGAQGAYVDTASWGGNTVSGVRSRSTPAASQQQLSAAEHVASRVLVGIHGVGTPHLRRAEEEAARARGGGVGHERLEQRVGEALPQVEEWVREEDRGGGGAYVTHTPESGQVHFSTHARWWGKGRGKPSRLHAQESGVPRHSKCREREWALKTASCRVSDHWERAMNTQPNMAECVCVLCLCQSEEKGLRI